MFTHRARAGEWLPGDPPERSGGGSTRDGTGNTGSKRAAAAVGPSRQQGSRRHLVAGGPATIRLVVADEHDVIRAGITSLIGSEPGYLVVGEAGDGQQAIELVERLSPDVILMDVRLPVIDGIEAARRMRSTGARAAVVLISNECDAETLMDALRAGVQGYVLNDVGREELLNVIRRVLTGGHAIETKLATELLRRMAVEAELHPSPAPAPLTPREIEVLRLISQGSTNRQIAARLIVAVGTVKVHVEHIMSKLGAVDRTQAAVRAIEMGIITNADDPEREVGIS